MSLDLRIPLGLMFSIVGAMLSIFGLITRGSSLYAQSAGLDINLVWGLVMFAFGLTMFLLGRRADRHRPAEEAPAPDAQPQRPSRH